MTWKLLKKPGKLGTSLHHQLQPPRPASISLFYGDKGSFLPLYEDASFFSFFNEDGSFAPSFTMMNVFSPKTMGSAVRTHRPPGLAGMHLTLDTPRRGFMRNWLYGTKVCP